MIQLKGYRRATRTFALLGLVSLSTTPFAGQAQAASGQGLSVNSQGQLTRHIDPDRILLTGNSLPRAAAYHAANGGSMGTDTQDQFARILLRDNPGPYAPTCIHAAPAGMGRYFADRRVSYQELLETCMRIGQSVGKPVYLEEFVPNPGNRGGFGFNQKQYFSDELKAIEASNIPLASVWVYDRKLVPDRSNITADNERSYMLSMTAAFNRSLHGQ